MTIREELERREHQFLSEKAQFADETKGRPRAEAPT